MTKKLKLKDYIFIGSMLFGLFFGAGNLIFPVHMGQLAGQNVFWANIGFLLTGIGLPFLGIIAMGVSKSDSVYDLASRVGRPYAKVFTILLYLVIGPFFALPRLATTSYEIGIAPHVSEGSAQIILAVFSIAFFLLAWFYSREPSRIVVYVGKVLNPIFLVTLGLLLWLAFTNPIASVTDMAVQPSYETQAFSNGFLEGYNTLDALAALAFGVVIISTLRNMGVTEPKEIAMDTMKSGTISVFLMGVIYSLLAYMGAKSLGAFQLSENGGIALAELSHHYLGQGGSILLALIVISACLKTAIGLITSFSETFTEIFPTVSYKTFIAGASLLAALVANVGLTDIIAFSIPVLMLIYPLAIVLIVLAIINPLFKGYQTVYFWTTAFTLIASVVDALNASIWNKTAFVSRIIDLADRVLPLFEFGMGWVLPAFIGFVVGYISAVTSKKETQIRF